MATWQVIIICVTQLLNIKTNNSIGLFIWVLEDVKLRIIYQVYKGTPRHGASVNLDKQNRTSYLL